LRFFGEIYHGYSSHEKEFAEFDKLDLHQGFVEIKFDVGKNKNISLRFGRQELSFGASRLVEIRDGPNIRRSFDAGRIIYSKQDTSVQAFYGKEVRLGFRTFDNNFSLFNRGAPNPILWGLYSQFKIKGDVGKTELYYFGFQSKSSLKFIYNKKGVIDLQRYEQYGTKQKRRQRTLSQLLYRD